MAPKVQTAVQSERDLAASLFARDVSEGLTARPRHVPPKYFYDEEGSKLFQRITELPEYYPTRCELSILREHAADLARLIPPRSALIEFGSGSSQKAKLLIAAAPTIEAYVPIDISLEMLSREAMQFRREHPKIAVFPVEADFTKPFRLPPAVASLRRIGFFPGSTIGNFEPHETSAFLRNAGRMLGEGALLIVGIDLVKDPAILNAAYDDSAGVTAKFNLNLLKRINRELGANFDLEAFSHEAFYNPERRRVEMHLASCKRQKVKVAGRVIDFRAGETIHTENSYKYTVESFGALARGSDWTPIAGWFDPQGYFSVQVLAMK